MNASVRGIGRLVGMLAVAVLALQLFFLLRIALMLVVAPESTSFQRSEIWRIAVEKHQLPWAQESVPGNRISDNLRRAVIASEDAGFVDHHGVEWGAVEKAWNKNEKAEARAEVQQNRIVASTKRNPNAKPRVASRGSPCLPVSQRPSYTSFNAVFQPPSRPLKTIRTPWSC